MVATCMYKVAYFFCLLRCCPSKGFANRKVAVCVVDVKASPLERTPRASILRFQWVITLKRLSKGIFSSRPGRVVFFVFLRGGRVSLILYAGLLANIPIDVSEKDLGPHESGGIRWRDSMKNLAKISVFEICKLRRRRSDLGIRNVQLPWNRF